MYTPLSHLSFNTGSSSQWNQKVQFRTGPFGSISIGYGSISFAYGSISVGSGSISTNEIQNPNTQQAMNCFVSKLNAVVMFYSNCRRGLLDFSAEAPEYEINHSTGGGITANSSWVVRPRFIRGDLCAPVMSCLD